MSSPFGERVDPYFHKKHLHNGQDLAVAKGTPVYAVADGRVVAEWDAQPDGKKFPNGNALKIDHGSGLGTAYLHLDSKAVRKGAHVRRGDVIGHVGTTGASTGPHLHFMVYKDEKPIDPKPFLAAASPGARPLGTLGSPPAFLPFLG